MKKAVSVILALVLLVIAATAVNAQVINRPAIKTTQEAVAQAEALLGHPVETARLYFKMPDFGTWYSDYGVFESRYYPSVYWWNGTAAPESYPGYRASIEDYAQGVYYADIPVDVSTVIWGNGFDVLDVERDTPKAKEITYTWDVNIEGAVEGDYETIPEGTPDGCTFDGYIYVLDPELSDTDPFSGKTTYGGDWYVYYGDGCYGSYEKSGGSFVSVEKNCLNPDHFDSQGAHIGGADIEPPVSPGETPSSAPADPALNGYYFVNSAESDIVRSENKLYPSTVDGEYYGYRYIDSGSRFRIVHYIDGAELSKSQWYPAEGWYNENDSIDFTPSGHSYTVLFRPDGSGDSSYIDGCLKTVLQEVLPTEVCTPTEVRPPAPAQYLYKEQFEKLCADKYPDIQVIGYKELYTHTDRNGEPDWALIYAFTDMTEPIGCSAVIGNRCIFSSSCSVPFDTGYGIYDIKTGEFIDAVSLAESGYEDFYRIFDEFGTGRLLGDMDGDDELTIIDVTVMQRCLARLRDYPEDDVILDSGDLIQAERYYSDFDRDGDRGVTDATALQRYLASMT